MSTLNQRKNYFDLLRVISSFAVVVIHVTSAAMNTTEAGSQTYMANALLNSIMRWAVPVFFMISGALFLDPKREVTTKKLFTKTIPHIVICIIIWGGIYTILDQYLYSTLSVKSIFIALYGIVTGNTGYHLWFLYDMLMIYIAVPIFRLITCNATKRQLEYALAVWFVVSIGVGHINMIAEDIFGIASLLPYQAYVVSGYAGYFLLGYYLDAYSLTGKMKVGSYMLSIMSVIAIVGGKLVLAMKVGRNTASLEIPLGVFSCMISAGLFTAAQNIKLNDNSAKITTALSKTSFGVYLVHVLLITFLYKIIAIEPNCCGDIITPIISSIGVYGVSIAISYGLSKIPGIRKVV